MNKWNIIKVGITLYRPRVRIERGTLETYEDLFSKNVYNGRRQSVTKSINGVVKNVMFEKKHKVLKSALQNEKYVFLFVLFFSMKKIQRPTNLVLLRYHL